MLSSAHGDLAFAAFPTEIDWFRSPRGDRTGPSALGSRDLTVRSRPALVHVWFSRRFQGADRDTAPIPRPGRTVVGHRLPHLQGHPGTSAGGNGGNLVETLVLMVVTASPLQGSRPGAFHPPVGFLDRFAVGDPRGGGTWGLW